MMDGQQLRRDICSEPCVNPSKLMRKALGALSGGPVSLVVVLQQGWLPSSTPHTKASE